MQKLPVFCHAKFSGFLPRKKRGLSYFPVKDSTPYLLLLPSSYFSKNNFKYTEKNRTVPFFLFIMNIPKALKLENGAEGRTRTGT